MMKAGFIFSSSLFWGVLLILFGISSILKSFNIHLPFFRVIVSLFFIYLGITILLGGPVFRTDKNTVLFGERRIAVTNEADKEYNIIFSSGEIDLSNLELDNNMELEINNIFSSSRIKVDPSIPLKIVASSAFSSVRMPDGNNIVFGESIYQSEDFTEDDKYIEIEANVVFGSLEVAEY
ncbi:cell wall-active antibiotics response protein [Natroniella sulfidigena]|uniref:cell wall-active antibiotics response protein n=1 Tax=Natroniella sulfidigena TaxID=723921 RepID=UPI00200B919B|nr:cell wall-active antibiotics response protein [Natroniella sulfidigena]MCK8817576.1 cell wall-active antibiotics response protein [Natroniella sulfidigena]